MSWVTIVWSMIAAVCLTLALQHLLLWVRQRETWANLWFATSALATAGLSLAELEMMYATTAERFSTAVRWYQVPVWVLILSLVGFVRLYLRAGRRWLAVGVCALRTLALVVNFFCTPNLNYREPVALRPLQFLGETIVVGQGRMNPWMLVGQLSLVLLQAFVLDAMITVGRRGDTRRALVVGGSIILAVTMGGALALMTVWGGLPIPIVTSFFYLGIAAAMSFQLSEDLARVTALDSELHESQQRLSLAAEAAQIGLFVWEIHRDTLWMTAQGRAMLGFTASEPLNLARFLANIHPADRHATELAVHESLQPGGKFEQEYRRLLPDDQIRWLAGFGWVECTAHGRPLRLRGVSLDITARVEAELAAQQHSNELARLSRVNLLGTLSGTIAHELNQPLAAILSNAQAAQRFLTSAVPDLDEVRDILHDIVADDRRAGAVIWHLRQLLEKGEIQRQPLDINDLVKEVLKLLRADLLHRQIAVETVLAAELLPVHGDPVQLQQVLINLIVNGCDAMQDNPVDKRTLRVSTAPAPEQRIKVDVTDQGQGVAVDQRKTIFQPFFTTKPHGMGMGLAVCRSIITAHQGQLWVEAAPDGGARFCFTAPTCAEQES